MGKRKDIKNSIVTILKKIKIADGYNNDIGDAQVFRNFKVPEDIRKFPALIIVSGDVIFTPKANRRYTTGGGIDSQTGWRVGVLCYEKLGKNDPNDEALLDDKMEDIIEDVIHVMTQNRSLDLSYVHNLYLKAVHISNDFITENIGIANVIFEIKYDFPITAA